MPEAYAVVREAAKRVLGMRHFYVQLVGGIVLHRGDIAEMKTGEGKTLVATLPAYLNALTGKGVHVVTVNDYLARRDREWMGQVFEFLGMTVGLNENGMTPEEKRAAYQADITFGTNNEFGFDYLRDNMVLYPEQIVQRELHFAIVDEVDSILIDEARTPLIISGQANKATDLYYKADQLVRRLKPGDDYTIDEKTRTVTLTESGVDKAESFLSIDNLYDARNITINHHVQQALKAHVLMKRDRDYVVNEDGVVIVDEFTGRLMHGRRYSDGLHQAIEAKEGLQVQRESMTLATITLQNYFRLYQEAGGHDRNGQDGGRRVPQDLRDERGADSHPQTDDPEGPLRCAVPHRRRQVPGGGGGDRSAARQGAAGPGRHRLHRQVGKLSRMLKKRGIPHQVLNAKNHAKEAEIIAQAGQRGAVTIATNMAGRGTDIVLGQGVAELGGLHVIGTERHESRRIDNQLRGRSGRQGDPGSSQFFLSLEDDLLRRFAPEWLREWMKNQMVDDTPIEGKRFSRSIESAQKKVEGINFDTRRWVLQYDDVLNQQREIIYKQRRQVLLSDNLRYIVLDMAKDLIQRVVEVHAPEKDLPDEWDLDSILDFAESVLFPEGVVAIEDLEECEEPKELTDILLKATVNHYELREKEIGFDRMQEFSKVVILRTVDRKWMDHIDAMDQLRQGIHLRAYGQTNPLREYQFEGYEMFEQMVHEIQEEVVKYVMKANVGENLEREEVAVNKQASAGGSPHSQGREEAPKRQPIRRQKVGRNEPCPCGSGKKYKHCCAKTARTG